MINMADQGTEDHWSSQTSSICEHFVSDDRIDGRRLSAIRFATDRKYNISTKKISLKITGERLGQHTFFTRFSITCFILPWFSWQYMTTICIFSCISAIFKHALYSSFSQALISTLCRALKQKYCLVQKGKQNLKKD